MPELAMQEFIDDFNKRVGNTDSLVATNSLYKCDKCGECFSLWISGRDTKRYSKYQKIPGWKNMPVAGEHFSKCEEHQRWQNFTGNKAELINKKKKR